MIEPTTLARPYARAAFEHARAADAKMAIQNARDLYTRRSEGRGIWVVPSKYIVASQAQDNESLFDPSDEKIYRHPTFYELPDGVTNM